MNDPKERVMPNLKVPLARPWFTEEEPRAAREVVESGWLIFGPRVEAFERAFAEKIGVKHAVAVNSGSSALLVIQAAAGVRLGDEVIVPNMTFVSTATSSMYLGGRPVFTDINLSVYGMDPGDIEHRITERTKVILPVHYAGQTADMADILAIAEKYNLMVIEDAAEAHLSEYNRKKAGALGHAGIFSFTPSKPMTTGEGGMITTDDDELAEKARLIRNFGDVDKFRWNLLGFNFRMPEVMGAIGQVQLAKLNEAVRRRREIARRYSEAFADLDGIIPPFVRRAADHNFQLYTIRLNLDCFSITRAQFIAELGARGVSARLYYPCLHSQPVFSGLGLYADADFPNAVEFSRTALSLPIYPGMTDEETEYVMDCVREIACAKRR